MLSIRYAVCTVHCVCSYCVYSGITVCRPTAHTGLNIQLHTRIIKYTSDEYYYSDCIIIILLLQLNVVCSGHIYNLFAHTRLACATRGPNRGQRQSLHNELQYTMAVCVNPPEQSCRAVHN